MYLYITHMLIQVVGVLTSWALQFVPYFCSNQCKLQGATGSCDLAHGQGSDFTPAVMRQEPRGYKGKCSSAFPRLDFSHISAYAFMISIDFCSTSTMGAKS